MIVVDLGCADPEGSGWSLELLAEEYKPDVIYGFDPSHTLDTSVTEIAGCRVVLSRSAAWTRDGEVRYIAAGTSSHVEDTGTGTPCFDFSWWLAGLAGEVIVKMDIEGAEYPLLERMVKDGTDKLISELLVEWHPGGDPAALEQQLACPVKAWDK